MKNKRTAILIGALIIILTAMGTCYFFVLRTQNNPTNNWETYKNGNGYSLKYPDNWEIWDASSQNNITLGSKDFRGIIEISMEEMTLDQFIEAINKDERNIRVAGQKSETFAGKPAIKLSLAISPYDVYFVAYGDKNFSIWRNKLDLDRGFDDVDIVETEDQILSTFRFEK